MPDTAPVPGAKPGRSDLLPSAPIAPALSTPTGSDDPTATSPDREADGGTDDCRMPAPDLRPDEAPIRRGRRRAGLPPASHDQM